MQNMYYKIYVCKGCGKKFQTTQQRKNPKYCSRFCCTQNTPHKCDSLIGKKKPFITGTNNKLWKGETVGYLALHEWVNKWKKKPKGCEFCGKNVRLDAANIDHKYRRCLDDYIYLCRKCHSQYDKRKGIFWLK